MIEYWRVHLNNGSIINNYNFKYYEIDSGSYLFYTAKKSDREFMGRAHVDQVSCLEWIK